MDSLDVFGIQKVYPTRAGGAEWDSAHWFNGRLRSIPAGARDPDDPTAVSQARGGGTVTIDGNGVLVLGGHQPRLYLNSRTLESPAKEHFFFRNVEMTVYYRRIADDGTPWGGLVMGARSGPNGHTAAEPCDAHTYYARLRHDGRKDFAKELQHPTCSVRNRADAWDGSGLPYDEWIGMKLVVRNVNGDRHVELEQYRDVSRGASGGAWERINQTIDAGGWAPRSRCPFPPDLIPTVGGGVAFIRNTGAREARYKWFTVREIDPRPAIASAR